MRAAAAALLRRVASPPRALRLSPLLLTGTPAGAEALSYLKAELHKCSAMEPIYWQRREGAH